MKIFLFAFVFSCQALATTWLTSDFAFQGTHFDLVNLQKAVGFEVKGKAVFDEKLYQGHLAVDGKAYACESLGMGVLMKGAPNEVICNMGPDVFLSLLQEKAVKGQMYQESLEAVSAYFKKHSSITYITIPVGFEASTAMAPSYYRFGFTDPSGEQSVEMAYWSSGVVQF